MLKLELELEVSDDIGVKSLYPFLPDYSDSKQCSRSDANAWTSIVMNGQLMNGQGNYESNVWTGVIPAQTYPESVTIYYRFLVSDDDPDGVTCDHTVEIEFFRSLISGIKLSYSWRWTM